MSQQSLREMLARVRQHLNASPSVDAESRRQLGGVTGELERALGSGVPDPLRVTPAGVAPRLESLAVRFEAGHPALAETLREIIDTLGKAGI
ncbi:MAG TPA: DUF4404 family protein [Steroidobacteraceae bacterium]|jgi:hypothetical protein|nr:DUF4404 family protein [Steroidobacteraceae bacterium]